MAQPLISVKSMPPQQSSNPVIYYFKPAWEEAYMFTGREGAVKCLVCLKGFMHLKKYNLRRHYIRYHAKDYEGYSPEERAEEVERLKAKLGQAEAALREEEQLIRNNDPAIRASYNIALEIAKTGRSFSDGETIRKCLLATAQQLWPEEITKVLEVDVSSEKMQNCIREMANNVMLKLNAITKKFIAFSLALDQTTDILGGPQLVVFIRGVDEKFTITEELLEIFPPGESTRGEDIVSCVEEAIEQNGLDWCKLVSVATDGGPAMVDANNGFVNCLRSKLRNLAVPQEVIAVHTIIHPETLCVKCIQFDHVMSVVVNSINFIRTHGVKYWQFRLFLKDLETEYGELPYHIDVATLGRGKTLEKFYNHRSDINSFMTHRGYIVPELQNAEWILDLSFVCDILEHVNVLNVLLQEEGKTIIELHDVMASFKMKLTLWTEQMQSGNVYHFSKLASAAPQKINIPRYVTVLKNLSEEFSLRFAEISTLEKDFNAVTTPFNVNIEVVPTDLQLELIDLKCDRKLKQEFTNRVDIIKFYKNLPQGRFPGLFNCAARILAMFGSTYVCEKFFSLLKKTGYAHRYIISDYDLKALKDSVILGTAQSIRPNIIEAIENKPDVSSSICVVTNN